MPLPESRIRISLTIDLTGIAKCSFENADSRLFSGIFNCSAYVCNPD